MIFQSNSIMASRSWSVWLMSRCTSIYRFGYSGVVHGSYFSSLTWSRGPGHDPYGRCNSSRCASIYYRLRHSNVAHGSWFSSLTWLPLPGCDPCLCDSSDSSMHPTCHYPLSNSSQYIWIILNLLKYLILEATLSALPSLRFHTRSNFLLPSAA